MNLLPSRSFRLRLLRAKGPAPYQPRATPWVIRAQLPSPEGAAQPHRPNMARPFRAKWESKPKPRALPWAGMARTVGAENPDRKNDQQVCALYGLTTEEISLVAGTAR